MTSSFSFGYELKSKQVRKYRPNDINSVRRAISVNAQEYLEYEGVEELQLSKWALLAGFLATGLGVAIHVMKMSLAKDPLLTTACISGFFFLVGGMQLSDYLQKNRDVIFVGTGKVTPLEGTKSPVAALKNQRLRLLLHCEEFSPIIRIQAQLVGKPHLFSPAKVHRSVEKSVPYGRYFSPSGYFFPPVLTNDLDDLVKKLTKKKKSS